MFHISDDSLTELVSRAKRTSIDRKTDYICSTLQYSEISASLYILELKYNKHKHCRPPWTTPKVYRLTMVNNLDELRLL